MPLGHFGVYTNYRSFIATDCKGSLILISKFLDKNFKNRVSITTVSKKTFRLVLPYSRTQYLRLKKKLNKIFKEQLPPGKLEIVFETTERILSCFGFKDSRFLTVTQNL